MSDRSKEAQHVVSESRWVMFPRSMHHLNTRHWLSMGIALALATAAACSSDSNPGTGGSGASGGATGSGGSGGSGKGGSTTTGGAGGSSGATGGSAGAGGAAGKGGAAGATGGSAGSAGSGGTAGAAGSGGAGGAKDSGAGAGGTAGSMDAGTPDARPDITMPPVDAGGDTVGGNLTVVSVEPTARTNQAVGSAPIVIHFDRPVNRATVTSKSLWAYGRWGGPLRPAMYTFANSDKDVSFAPPTRNWPAGDRVTVVLANTLAGADGAPLRSQGYSYQYTTVTKAANQMYTEVQRLTSRTTASTTTRTYGGSVADLNNDGYLDLMTINEDSADMRIFLNKGAAATATSQYNPFVTPPTKVGQRASPSETTDFNGDGIVDIAVANLDANTLSVLFGNNDGTFTTSQTPQVGGQPRGVAVIDVDGDGDIDIINTNANGDNMSLLKNDGTGKFPLNQAGGIIFWDSAFGMGTATQEFGLMAGDMNEDGILDIVIGARGMGGNNRATVVNLGTGNGTFAFGSLQAPTTSGWQVSVGDMNNDGHEDVATVDADLQTTLSLNTVSILLGDGKGKVNLQQTYTGGLNRPFAIDMGDIDGDKDQDLVVSNFSGNWVTLLNDGTSKVAQGQTWTPAQSASCALLIDMDNDQDLDLVVVDEEEDQVVVLRQSP
jgi:hypothetical protein